MSRRWQTPKMIWIFFFLLIGVFPSFSTLASETVIITLQFRDASEALPIIQNLLSKEGKISIDTRTNSLVITDRKEYIAQINAFLAQFDVPVEQVKIRVRFNEAGTMNSQSIAAQGRASGKNWQISTGPQNQNGVQVSVQDQEQRQTGITESFILTGSGQWAYIAIGRDILYTQKWIEISGRYARAYEGVVVKRIETGFDVKPVLAGDQVLIDIVPRISSDTPDKGRDVIYFSKASVKLRVPLGQWVEIGGTNQSGNEIFNAILSHETSDRSENFSISLLVEKL
jgi:type II secretory pathway component GspD/PulD (secretin)